MKNAYAYVQPSLIEGLSPVILTVMGLGTPLICSDIKENLFICGENASCFVSGNAQDLTKQLEYALNNETDIVKKAITGQTNIIKRFNWDSITDDYIELFKSKKVE
jgi:glycosyltransferase involved in cell wall biosynthesis